MTWAYTFPAESKHITFRSSTVAEDQGFFCVSVSVPVCLPENLSGLVNNATWQVIRALTSCLVLCHTLFLFKPLTQCQQYILKYHCNKISSLSPVI